MPYSELDVVNQALSLIGKPAVTNTSDSPQAFLMANRLQLLKPDILLETIWNFAREYVSNDTPLVNNFTPEYPYTYQLPYNYGRFDRLAWPNVGATNYEITDGLLLCNARPITYYYVVNDAAYSTLTSSAVLALAHLVASKTALVLTNNINLTKYLEEQYTNVYLPKAILFNDMERQISQSPNDFDRQVYI